MKRKELASKIYESAAKMSKYDPTVTSDNEWRMTLKDSLCKFYPVEFTEEIATLISEERHHFPGSTIAKFMHLDQEFPARSHWLTDIYDRLGHRTMRQAFTELSAPVRQAWLDTFSPADLKIELDAFYDFGNADGVQLTILLRVDIPVKPPSSDN